MTDIFFIFAPMNYLFKVLRFLLLTIIAVPLWVISSLIGFCVAMILYFIFSTHLNTEHVYFKSKSQIFKSFKVDLLSIFYYY